MTVFSGCLKIIKSKIGITIMYFVIFTGISIAMQLNNSKQSVTDFQSKRMDIAFVDCDKSEISGYIYDYLNTNHNVKKMKNDNNYHLQIIFSVYNIIKLKDKSNVFYNKVIYNIAIKTPKTPAIGSTSPDA